MRSGFSLIELLVVVAIIGILATVGLVGYQLYIDSSRDEVSIDVGNFIDRTINTDVVSIENNLSARSELTKDIKKTNKCWEMVSDLVTYVNSENDTDGKNNPFDKTKGSLCDGVHAASGAADITLPRGGTIVYCDGLDTVAHKIKLSNNINIRRCTCTESDCTLTTADRRCVARLDQAVTSGSATISFAIQSYSPANCIDSNTSTLKVSNKLDSLTVTSCNATSCNVTSPFAIDNSTLIYEDSPSACYYPFGFASETDYFTALSTHSGGTYASAADYDRHICK